VSGFKPAVYIRDEMTARGMTREDLANAWDDMTTQQIADLLDGTTHVTQAIADRLAILFGNDPQTWMYLQRQWNATGQETEMLKSRLECSKRQARRWKKLVHQTQGKMAVLRHENNKLRAANDKLRNPE